MQRSPRLSPVVPVKDQRVRSGGGGDGRGHGSGCREEQEKDRSFSSISWKPLGWPRSGSLSSPSAVKVVGSEVEEGKHEVPTAAEGEVSPAPVQSQVGSPTVADEGNPRKKQRLGWGQGLAKYEKEKVEGSETSPTANAPLQGGSSAGAVLTERSFDPADVGEVLCSPTAQQSGSCILSPVLDDKSPVAVESTEYKKHCSVLPDLMWENFPLDSSIDIEDLDISSLNQVHSLVTNLLQAEHASIGELSNFKQLALSKLLLLKGEVSKLIEKAETVIDSFEVEFKNLVDKEGKTDSTLGVSALHVDDVQNLSVPSAPNREYDSLVSPRAPHHEDHADDYQKVINHNSFVTDKDILHSNEYQLTANSASASDAKSMMVLADHVVDQAEKEAHLVFSGPSCLNMPSATDVPRMHAFSASCLEGNVDVSLATDIMNSNREFARKATEIFSECSPCKMPPFDPWISDDAPNPFVKEKLMVCKQSLRFKERVLSLKFKALHHLWRENLRVSGMLIMKKNTSKFQKRSEIRCLPSQNGLQKPRSLTRPRSVLPGNFILSPSDEILDLTSKLISDSESPMCRTNLKMPAMIIDERELRHSRFITSNGLVEDPVLTEKERSIINLWSEEEKKLFIEKLGLIGKDFHKIASFLDHKTTADCVEFYYKNRKSESFKAVRESLGSRKRSQLLSSGKYMVTSGKKWKSQPDGAPLDVLGAASLIVSQAKDVSGVRQKFYGRSFVRYHNALKKSRAGHCRFTAENHAESTAADVLAGIGCAMSSEGMSSCITSSIDPTEKVDSVLVDCLFPEVSQTICEEDNFSDDGVGELEIIDWSDDEKSIFIRALRSYGKDFARISVCLGTRSREQCKVFFSKAKKCLGLDVVYQGPSENGETPVSDVNGGRSDTDEACAADIDSMICSTQSYSTSVVDWQGSATKLHNPEASQMASFVVPVMLTEGHGVREMQGNFETGCQSLHSSIDEDNQFQAEELTLPDRMLEEQANTQHTCILVTHADQLASNDNTDACGTAFVSCEADACTEPVGGRQLNSNDVSKMDAGCFSLDVSVPKMDSQLLTVTDKMLQKDPGINSNVSVFFDSSTVSSNCHAEKYGNSFLDTPPCPGFSSQQGLNLPTLFTKKSPVISSKQTEKLSWSTTLLPDDYELIVSRGHDPPNSCKQKENLLSSKLLPDDHKPIVFRANDEHTSLKQKENSPSSAKQLLDDKKLIVFSGNVQPTSCKKKGNSPSSKLSPDDYKLIVFGGHGQVGHLPPSSFLEGETKHHLAQRSDYPPIFVGSHSIAGSDQSGHVLRGYPLHLLSKDNELRDPLLQKPVALGKVPNNIGSSPSSQLLFPELHVDEHKISALFDSERNCSYLHRSGEAGDVLPKPYLPDTTTELEKNAARAGDVKLFGQILSPPSPVQKADDTKVSPTSIKENTILNFQLPNGRADRASDPSNAETSSHLGLTKELQRSYKLWDGYDVPTGFSSLATSASCLSKCPSVVSGVAYHPKMVKHANGDVPHQGLFPAEGKGRLILSESQNQVRIDSLPGLEQPTRVAVNMVGCGDSLACTMVSDPIAALRLHFAKQMASLGSNGDSPVGDLGNR